MPLARRFGAFGVRQQFTGGLIAAVGQLRVIQHTGGLLGSQFGDTLLIQRHVQRSTVFFLLLATATQGRDQQKAEGGEQQQARTKPEFSHGSVLYPTVWRDVRVLRRTARASLG
ncbi:hypothetical protein D3C81_1950300 [compost metagenome]